MIKKLPLEPPVLLNSSHRVDKFDCGSEALNTYLKRFACTNNQNGSARTYVAVRGNQVVGYYTLAAGSVAKAESPERVGKGLANHPVPVILLARLARHQEERGTGLGAALLKEALIRIIQAADIIGVRAILAHAKDDKAKEFYLLHGFEPSPVDPFHLYLLLKDIRKTFGI